jgi:hypothetical protein
MPHASCLMLFLRLCCLTAVYGVKYFGTAIAVCHAYEYVVNSSKAWGTWESGAAAANRTPLQLSHGVRSVTEA